MKITKLFTMMFFVVLAFTACKKDVNNPTDNQPGSMNDLVISDDFNWETTKDIDVTISISGAKDYQAKSKVSVFNADPASGGKLMVSGNAAPGSSFTSSMRIPSYLTQLYLKMESPFTGNQTVTVPVSGNAVNYTFDSQKSGDDLKSVIVEPACGEAGDIPITQTNGTLDIKDGATYSLAGTFNGTINFDNNSSGGTLKVCGTVNATNNVQLNKATDHLIVTQGGTFTCSDLSLTHSAATVSVYSNSLLDINNNFSPKGFVKNYGTVDVEQSWENTSGSGGYFENYGTILVGKDMKLNTNTQNINACKIIVQDKFHQDKSGCTFIMEAGSYLETGDDAEFTKDNTIMKEGSMIKCPKFFTNSSSVFTINGDALVLVSEVINIKGNINGPLTVAYQAGVIPTVSGSLTGGAIVTPVANLTTYLPISACNPVGFGTPPIVDTDNDGVPDETDLYPNDNQRAANSYFPAQDVWGTVAFEDLWPSKGDYDFNDLVLDYTGYYVLNAQNNVKDFIVKFEVRAVGASFNNGFGFQLDQIAWNEVESVTGFVHESTEMTILLNANNTEASQPKAVIIAVSTVESVINRASGSMFNTIPTNPTGTWDLTTITTTFVNAVPQSNVGMEDFNPFLIKNQDRTVEVHLPNMAPTAKANQTLFGTFEDNSIPGDGRYYKTKNNLPWGILIFERFDYPIESVEIIDAYLYFDDWAESNGVVHTDWYTDESGRVPANIY